MNWYLQAMNKYVVFSGRAQRAEYWVFFTVNLAIYIGAIFIDSRTGSVNKYLGLGPASGIFALIVLLPSAAVAVRRLHDTNRSAWWLLLTFIPILGPLSLFVIYCLEGTPGDNDYGPDPRLPAPEPAAASPVQEPPSPPAEQQNG
jgi:uncharacterized membrane protein YhaH (DUF805 family)